MNISKNQFKCSEIKSEITFKNKVYPVREIIVYDGPENGNGLYRVSTYELYTELRDYIVDGKVDEYTEEANSVYDNIWFFANESEFSSSTEKLALYMDGM